MCVSASVEVLIEKLGDQDAAIREGASAILLGYGGSVIDDLIEALDTGNRYQGYEAVRILLCYKDRRCFQAVAKMICSSNLMAAHLATRSLITYGRERAFHALIRALPNSHLLTQTQILLALKEIGDKRAINPLIALLQSTDSVVLRYSIIEILGVLGAVQAVELIRSFQFDEDRHVRDRVSAALSALEHIAAQPSTGQVHSTRLL